MSNISAKIICDSIANGVRLTTFELEYPRFIHSEFMTHRMLSKNSASSRAIPIKAMHKHLEEVPQYPSRWGKNQPGMQAKEDLTEYNQMAAKDIWDAARRQAISHSVILDQIGAHKQIANRVTEPYMQMKVVCSGTDYKNFFWLRDHEDADPTIQDLAQKMVLEYEQSTPEPLRLGEWHLPYIERRIVGLNIEYALPGVEKAISLEDAKIISASCCAQVSYRKLDDDLAKAQMIYDKLINSQPVHASPVEHQATPIPEEDLLHWDPRSWPQGVTHVDGAGQLWSGNFRGWIQHRQLIKNHSVKG